MSLSLRVLARRLLGVTRTPTYYLPWLTRPGLECALILNNVEARFMEGHRQGPFPVSAVQHDASGAVVRRYEATLADSADTVELALEPTAAGCGFVSVDVSRIHSDLYVTLSDGDAYTATHGRQEFVETYPIWARAVIGALGAALAGFGRTIPAFTRHQFVYLGTDNRSHVLLMHPRRGESRRRRSGRPAGVAAAHGRPSPRRVDARPRARPRHPGAPPPAPGQCLVQPLSRRHRPPGSGRAPLLDARQVAAASIE